LSRNIYVLFETIDIVLLNNDSLATCHSNSIIRIWDIITKSQIKQLTGHQDWVRALAKMTHEILASGSDDKSVKIWNWTSGQLIKSLDGHSDYILGLVLLSNGNLACCFGEIIQIFNTTSNRSFVPLQGHEAKIQCLTLVSSDLLASGSLDRTIRVWNVTTGRQTLTLSSDLVECLLLLENGAHQTLASGEQDSLIKIWSLETGRLLTYLPGHAGTVTRLVNLRKSHMASCSTDMSIKIWNYENYLDYGAVLMVSLRGHSMKVSSLLLLPDGKLASASWDRTVKIWNLPPIFNYPNRANLIASVDD
jgi:WD40 repeat protein